MGGCSMDDDWELTSPESGPYTLVLVGRTGNGKSATGNSILGRAGANSFESGASSAGVTSTCELQQATFKDGQVLNVIDTPGLFDSSLDSEFIGKEIVKCINMAKDGIHAVLFVLSIRNRFSKEEEAAFNSLRTLFGSKINDYMIVVFTGGDDLEADNKTLDHFLVKGCPEPLKKTLRLCGNRRVLFDNRKKDEGKKAEQVRKLLSLVNMVIAKNDGKPFTNEIFGELKKGTMELHDHTKNSSMEGCSKQEISELNEKMQKAYEDQLKRMVEMVESKLKESTQRLEKQLAEEQAAKVKAQKQLNDEISKLRENLKKAQDEAESLRKETTQRLEKQLTKEQAARVKAQKQSNDEIRQLRESLKKAQDEAESLRKKEGSCSIL